MTSGSGCSGLRPPCVPCRIDSASTRCCRCCCCCAIPGHLQPAEPIRGSFAPTDRFRAAVQEAKIGPDNDIPHVSAPIIIKYVTDLQLLGLL